MPAATLPTTALPSADLVFRAFSDRTRLRLLSLLHNHAGEVCVCDLVRVLGLPQAKVSRHLAYLRKAGLVTVRSQGPWRFYTLARPASDFHRRLIDCLACCFAEVPELRRDRRKLSPSACNPTANTRCC